MKILLAEDEKDLARALTAVLEHNQYEVTAVCDGLEAVEAAKSTAYDCMIFDIMMPKMDGITALQQIREAGDVTPALFLTAKAEMDDKVIGLDAGADDYLTKPFAMVELLARIRSLTRRKGEYTPKKLSFGSVTLDVTGQELVSENSVRLAGMESNLMEFFMRNPNKSFTMEEIHAHVWKDSAETVDVVWVYISYLRNKLKSIAGNICIEGKPDGTFKLTET
ncbi:MAG: response regulator transcription factor [Lachnospiraceae bacterium]|nr:response regulator transcription factor [Lachnospiraceae bacterium]